jgi:hypothetical protein
VTRSEQQRRRENRIYAALSVAFIATAIGFLYLNNLRGKVALDARTLCPQNDAPVSLLVVMVDTSDSLNIVQRTAVTNQIQQATSKIPDHGEVELFTIGPVTNTLLEPQVSVCNPGNAKGASELTSNQQLIGKRWKKKFIEPLNKQLARMLGGSGSKDSPIMEGIQSVAVSVFGKPDFHDVNNRQLIIVSDMLQNTAGYSHYRGDESYSRFRTSSYCLKVRPNLDGVDVTILYLRRAEVRRLQGKRHLKFWEDYFTDAKARLMHVVSIEG